MPSQQFFHLLNALNTLQRSDKFSAFQVINAQYKSSPDENSHIAVDILVPRILADTEISRPCPIIIRIHGGFLVTGSSLYAPWFNDWILDYAIANRAVVISSNYRLLPEATGRDILDDIHDFWHWLRNTASVDGILRQTGYDGISLDRSSILLIGESAGGYLATQLAITFPSAINSVIAAYPMLDLRSRFYTESYSKPIVHVPNIPASVLMDHLTANNDTGTWITAVDPPDRLELAFSIVQNGLFLDVLGAEDKYLFPMDRIEDLLSAGKSIRLPPMFIFHGEQDSAVPIEGSRKSVQFLRRMAPTTSVMLYTQDGDHGFDAGATLETPWLRDRLARISAAWLKQSSANL